MNPKAKLKLIFLFLPSAIVLAAFLFSLAVKAPEQKTIVQWVGAFIAAIGPIPVWWLEREENKLAFDFGLSAEGGRGHLLISNYSRKIFTINKINVKTSDDLHQKETSVTIMAGDQKIDITEELVKAVHEHWDDVEISFEYSSVNGSGLSQAKPYHVVALDGVVGNVVAGFHEMRIVGCPACGAKTLFSVEDLKHEADVLMRKATIANNLKKSCPNHKSKWLTSSTGDPKFFAS